MIVRSDGSIFFTDPIYGRAEYYGLPRQQQLGVQGVYRIDADGCGPHLLVSDFDQPNGLSLAVDESKMYINDTPKGHIREFDVAPDGSLAGGGVWAEVTGEGDGATDGLTIDREGNLYTTGPRGIHVFGPDAICLGVIHVPEVAANFTWGGDDLRTLFVTASSSLYRTRVKVPGRQTFHFPGASR